MHDLWNVCRLCKQSMHWYWMQSMHLMSFEAIAIKKGLALKNRGIDWVWRKSIFKIYFFFPKKNFFFLVKKRFRKTIWEIFFNILLKIFMRKHFKNSFKNISNFISKKHFLKKFSNAFPYSFSKNILFSHIFPNYTL